MSQRLLKVTISGSYTSGDHKIVDFSKVSGLIPFCDDDVAFMHIKDRYSYIWISNDDRYKERVNRVRETYIDNIEEVEGDLTYVGKNIADLSFEELQDLATAKGLNAIPLWRKGGLRHAQQVAYAEYSTKVLGEPKDHRVAGFNIAQEPPIIVDAQYRRDKTKKMSNDEYIARSQENAAKAPKTTMSMADLKEIADSKGIKYHVTVGYDTLYKRVYPEAA